MKLIKQNNTLWITGNKEYQEYYISGPITFIKDIETTFSRYTNYQLDFIFTKEIDREKFENLIIKNSIKYVKISRPKETYIFSEAIKIVITKENYITLAKVLKQFGKLGYKTKWKVGVGAYIIM